MPATVSQVMTGVKNRLATITGLRVFDFQPDNINPPSAFPQIDSVEYHGAFGGGDVRFNMTVVTIVGRVSDRTAQSNLDAYLSYSGASSIREAIEADRSLGGVVQTLVVNQSANIRTLAIGEAEYLTIEITLVVHG
jgi:hypothetical protein